MRFFKKPAIQLLWIFATWYLPVAPYTVAGSADGIHYDKITDSLTVHVQEMPLGEILQKIGAKSGIKFSIEADLNRPVTMDLTAVPLDKAIYSLVQPNSSAMIYSKKEDGAVVLTSVKIFDKGGAPPSSSEPLRRWRGDPSVYDDANQAARSRANVGPGGGSNRKNRSHRDADIVLPDSDSQADSGAGSIQKALELFSSGGMWRGR